jgi:hypothetical protein
LSARRTSADVQGLVDSWIAAGSRRSTGVRDQRWGGFTVEVGTDGFEPELKNRVALLRAGGDDRPDPFEPARTGFAPRSLSDTPVDHDETNRWLGQLVGRLEARRRDEAEGTGALFLEAPRQVGGRGGRGNLPDGGATPRLASRLPRGGERRGPQGEDPKTVGLVLGLGRLREELQIGDERPGDGRTGTVAAGRVVVGDRELSSGVEAVLRGGEGARPWPARAAEPHRSGDPGVLASGASRFHHRDQLV